MPGPDGIISVALDFDGSLVELHEAPLRWRPRARDFVLAAAASGIRLVVHSCRCTLVGYDELPGDAEEFYRSGRVPAEVEHSWALREEMVAFLAAEGVLPLVSLWEGPGKPICDVYADDRAERPDWVVLAGELGVPLGHGGPGLDPPMGQPGARLPGGQLPPAPGAAPAGPAPGDAPAAPGGLLLGS